MKLIFTISIFCLQLPLCAQFYLKAEVKDANGKPVVNAKVWLYSKGNDVLFTDHEGKFNAYLAQAFDSVFIEASGFEYFRGKVNVYQKNQFVLASSQPVTPPEKLTSLIFHQSTHPYKEFSLAGETYNLLVYNRFVESKKFPTTGYAINTDRASYSNIRRFINNEIEVPTVTVRMEELLNYFDYDSVNQSTSFKIKTALTGCPWNASTKLLFIHSQAPQIDISKVPPSNLVFLIDVSSSMDHPNRLPLLKVAFKKLVQQLREQDTISIVVYGGNVGIHLAPTSGKFKDSIFQKIEQLEPSGSTPGASAIKTAYSIAKQRFIKEGNNRIILATDGDFNIGITSDKELEELIEKHTQEGIYLTCLGVGMGNYKDSRLENLAKKGQGNLAYLDDLKEAEKILVKEFTKTLFAVATDAFIEVQFDSSAVEQYRLIGYDNRQKALDAEHKILEGGEVGSGHQNIAVFEITTTNNFKNQLGTLSLHYQNPFQDNKMIISTTTIEKNTSAVFTHTGFATTIILFGELLRKSEYVKNISWDTLVSFANTQLNRSNIYQREFYELLLKAKDIYTKKKKKR